jgi:beta-phosphoglucomutase family hydrolase
MRRYSAGNCREPSLICEPINTNTKSWGSYFSMKLKLPAGDFRAYLFDCDGTIADSMPLHYKAWKRALGDWNCEFEENLFYSWGGKPVRKIIADLNEMHGLNMPVESLAAQKESYYHAQLPELKAIPEVLEHIEAQHGRIPFAVVSGSRRSSVVGSLTTLNLLDKFDVLVCAEDYKHGKPAPDGFLLAAAKLGVAPEKCLVFEDTDLGIQAATAAGMASVLVAQERDECYEGTAAANGA